MSAASFSSLTFLGDGADDEAGARWTHPVDQVAQPAALLLVLLDPARDADVIHGGHEDQMPAGQGDVRGDPGPLGADRILDDLHDDLLAFLQKVLDVLLLAGAPLLVAPVAVAAPASVPIAAAIAAAVTALASAARLAPLPLPVGSGLAGSGLGPGDDLPRRRRRDRGRLDRDRRDLSRARPPA